MTSNSKLCYRILRDHAHWCAPCKAFVAEAFVSAPRDETLGMLRLRHLCENRAM